MLSTLRANSRPVASVTPCCWSGLTGGIGSGKSTVADLLRQKGATVVDADEAARAVVEPGQPALAALVERFGHGILLADGRLDRPAWPRIAFADEDSRQALERDHLARDRRGVRPPDRGGAGRRGRRVRRPAPGRGRTRRGAGVRGGDRGRGAARRPPRPARGARHRPRRRRAADGRAGDRRRAPRVSPPTCSTTPATSTRSPARSTRSGPSSSGSARSRTGK